MGPESRLCFPTHRKRDPRPCAWRPTNGPNASGTSNLVEAIAWLSRAVGRSLRTWDEFIPCEPFKFGQGPKPPSTYDVEMIVEGVPYAYRVDVDDSAVLFERMYSYPERRRHVLFEREDLEIPAAAVTAHGSSADASDVGVPGRSSTSRGDHGGPTRWQAAPRRGSGVGPVM
jgi:hypothetical protein